MIIITPYHGKKGNPHFEVRKKYLEDTIHSIDVQSCRDIFHIIIDDGSDDGFYDMLKNRYRESGVRTVIRREKPDNEILTASNALNYVLDILLDQRSVNGIDLSSHDLITFIDSDDLIVDLHKRVEEMKNKELDFLYTDALLFFDDSPLAFFWRGIKGTFSHIFNNFWVSGRMPYPTMTWKKDFLLSLRSYNKNKYHLSGILDSKIGCGQDVDLALSSFEYAKLHNLKIGYLPEITAAYRLHESSIAAIRNQRERSKEENIVIVRHFGKFGAVCLHLKRLVVRPECYFPIFMKVRSFFRQKIEKGEILKNVL